MAWQNTVEGVTLQGAGCSWTTRQPWDQIDLSKKGSRGLGVDSSQGWAMTHGGSEGSGSCYQNTVHNVQILDIDVGVYLGPEVGLCRRCRGVGRADGRTRADERQRGAKEW
jgi:hypothetical protein